MVRQLWDELIREPHDLSSIHEQARSLLDRANSETPVVNWGLTELYMLTASADYSAEAARRSQSEWLAALERYHRDPEGWMGCYLQRMIADFTTRHGSVKGQAFADKLLRSGYIKPEDFPH